METICSWTSTVETVLEKGHNYSHLDPCRSAVSVRYLRFWMTCSPRLIRLNLHEQFHNYVWGACNILSSQLKSQYYRWLKLVFTEAAWMPVEKNTTLRTNSLLIDRSVSRSVLLQHARISHIIAFWTNTSTVWHCVVPTKVSSYL